MSHENSLDGLKSVLGSTSLARLVLHFSIHPDTALHFRALQRHTGLGNRSLQQQLEKLVAWGVVQRDDSEASPAYRAIPTSPRWQALRSLIRSFADPAEVLAEALTTVEGIEAAFVFGSTARGEARDDSDIDLFVLGDRIPSAKLGRATSSVEIALGREVDVKRFTPDKLARAVQGGSVGFVGSALHGPKRWVVGSDQALALYV